MNKSTMIRRLISAPPAIRSTILQQRLFAPQSRQYAVQSVTQASFWANMIPKPFRKSERAMIALRNEYTTFSRRADAKIGVLKEIIQRIRNGEKPDVEALLGVGDREQEREWEEVLQEIEREDAALQQSPAEKSKPENVDVPATKKKAAENAKSKSNVPSGFY